MSHPRGPVGLLSLVGLVALSACEEATPPPAAPLGAPVAPAPPAATFSRDEAAWGPFHSKRHFLTARLPEGRAWRIDDHTTPELRAKHPATRSELILAQEPAGELVGRAQCEAIARKKGRVPKGDLRTLEDHVTVGPEAYDTRIWAAIEVARGGTIVGHLFAFGGNLRTCLFFHFRTEVEGLRDEGALSERLALAKTGMFARLAIDPPRITVDAEVPRAPAVPPKR